MNKFIFLNIILKFMHYIKIFGQIFLNHLCPSLPDFFHLVKLLMLPPLVAPPFKKNIQ